MKSSIIYQLIWTIFMWMIRDMHLLCSPNEAPIKAWIASSSHPQSSLKQYPFVNFSSRNCAHYTWTILPTLPDMQWIVCFYYFGWILIFVNKYCVFYFMIVCFIYLSHQIPSTPLTLFGVNCVHVLVWDVANNLALVIIFLIDIIMIICIYPR